MEAALRGGSERIPYAAWLASLAPKHAPIIRSGLLGSARGSKPSRSRKTYAEAAGVSTNANATTNANASNNANARYSHLIARIVYATRSVSPAPGGGVVGSGYSSEAIRGDSRASGGASSLAGVRSRPAARRGENAPPAG
jgi:hypothetical protein